MILYLIFYEVYFMNTFSFMQRKHKKEIVFMKVVNQVVSIQHLIKIADPEPAGIKRLGKFSDRYGFHQ